MNRRNLIKGIFTSLALLVNPSVKTKAEKLYTFKELFTNRVFRNSNMFFLKKTHFKDRLYREVGHLIKTEGSFFYMGEHDITLPIKSTYTERELEAFFTIAAHRILTYGMLLQNPKGEPIYFMRNPPYGRSPKHLRLELICDFKKTKTA